jgi:hypothetical protein
MRLLSRSRNDPKCWIVSRPHTACARTVADDEAADLYYV